MTRYRLRCGVRTWPWRETHRAAVADALDANLARPDEHHPKRVIFDELVVVEEER